MCSQSTIASQSSPRVVARHSATDPPQLLPDDLFQSCGLVELREQFAGESFDLGVEWFAVVFDVALKLYAAAERSSAPPGPPLPVVGAPLPPSTDTVPVPVRLKVPPTDIVRFAPAAPGVPEAPLPVTTPAIAALPMQ